VDTTELGPKGVLKGGTQKRGRNLKYVKRGRLEYVKELPGKEWHRGGPVGYA